MKNNTSLKHQILLSNILIFVVPIFIIGSFLIISLNKKTKESIVHNNMMIANNIDNHINSFIQSPTNLMLHMKEFLEKDDIVNESNVEKYLENVNNLYNFFDRIIIVDKDGKIEHIAPYNKDHIGISVKNMDYYKNIDKSGKPVWSKVFISTQTNKPTVTISIYFNGKLLVGYLNLTRVTDIIQDIPVEAYGSISILDENGIYIQDKNYENVSQRRVFKDFQKIKQGLSENRAMINIKSTEDLLLYSAKIESTGWYSVIVMEEDVIYAPVDRLKTIFLVGLVLFLLLSVAISTFSVNRITGSLNGLINKTKLIAKGDYSVEPETKGYKEFIELYNNFNIMKESIQERENRINISKNKLIELNKTLDNANTLQKAILESSPDMIIFALDTNYCYQAFNKKHKEVMYSIWGKEIKIGMSILQVIGDHEDAYKAKNSCDKALAGESFILTEEYGDEKYSRLYWRNYWSPILSNDGKIIGITCFVMNVTDQKKAQDEMEYLSYHDQLTGLYNRRFYEEEIKRMDTEDNLPLTIVMSDVNGLKLINDSFGHALGDELLKKVSNIIKDGCRKQDIVARLSGDEFVILLPNTDLNEAEKVVKRIKERTMKEKIGSIDISISFGYEAKYDKDQTVQEVFKSAEDNMYKKKLFESPSMRGETINTIIKTLHEKNKREEQHSYRVSQLCEDMGKALGSLENDLGELKTVGLLHDIGKIAINESILNKPGKLIEDEWEEVKRHPEIGYRILSTVNDMSEIAKYVLYHHERWDGMGYPKGLKGKEIPVQSRIISIIDSYDAMTSERSYRGALPEEVAIKELRKHAGIQFDPELVEVFIEKVLKNK